MLRLFLLSICITISLLLVIGGIALMPSSYVGPGIIFFFIGFSCIIPIGVMLVKHIRDIFKT